MIGQAPSSKIALLFYAKRLNVQILRPGGSLREALIQKNAVRENFAVAIASFLL
jgi:hypothetical protein